MPSRRILLGGLGALAVSTSAGAAASSAGQSAARKVYLFNIPAQPLQPALVAYADVVGAQIIYDSKLARDHRSSPVIGLFTADVALRMLLEGSGLTVVPTGTQDIALASVAAVRMGGSAGGTASGEGGETTLVLDTLYVDAPPGAERRPDFTDYGQLVRSEIKQALTHSPETARRIYDIRIELWVDARGGVRRPRLLRSSGRADLDAAIERALAAIVLKTPPPSGMPQPIRVAVVGL